MPTAIEWTNETWNPVTGCSKVSPGCAHCYAETISKRFSGVGAYPVFKPWTPENAEHNVQLHPERLDQPLRWRKPRMVFVNSMSDLFHELIPDKFIASVFDRMAHAPQHTFQILTKRPERAREWFAETSRRMVGDLGWNTRSPRPAPPEYQEWPLPNVWLGVSIENARHTWRADVLREIPAAVRFLSCEPLLGSLFNVRSPSYNPVNDSRGQSASGSGTRGASDRPGWLSLEDRSAAGEAMGAGISDDPVRAAEGRTQADDWVPSGARDVRGGQSARDGSPAGLPALRGADPGRDGDQPPERDQGRQQAGKSRSGIPTRAGRPRAEDAEASRLSFTERAGEPSREADGRAGADDSITPGERGTAGDDRGGLRDRVSDGIEYRSRQAPLDLTGISWVIVGGESGPGARPMHPDWAREIRDACFYENLQRDPNGLDHAGPAFFFKQWGEWLPYEPDDAPFWTGHDGHIIDGHALPYLSEHDVVDGWWWPDPESAPIYRKLGKKRAGRLLDGREWSEFPVVDVVEGHRYEGTRA